MPKSYTYACREFPGMEACPGEVTAETLLPLLGAQGAYEAGLWIDILRSRVDAIAKFEDRDIKRTTTKVEDSNCLVSLTFFVESVCKRCSSWLVDDSLHFKTGNLTSVFSSLSLCIVKVSRHCNDSFGYILAEVLFCISFEL